MPDWRVVPGERFVATIEATTADLKRQLETAKASKSRDRLGEVEARLFGFNVFTQAVEDLANGKSDPTKLLKSFGVTEAGTPVYVLTSGGWRGSFLADPSAKVCSGISIYALSRFDRLTETIRSPFRRFLR
jgi:hypothetical protein